MSKHHSAIARNRAQRAAVTSLLAGALILLPLASRPSLAAPPRARSLEELVDKRQPGIALVREWIRVAKNPVEVLPVNRADGERALVALQVTSRSPMGAIALETGGLLIDHGWIRVLGGGNKRLPRAIHQWNRMALGAAQRFPGTILVADDVLGGFFAINGGRLKGPLGHVFYYSPQSLEWEDVAPSYSEWLVGIMSGDLNTFYEGLRWSGWRREVEPLSGERGISVYPFLFAAGEEIAKRSRKPVPLEELWTLHLEEVPRQLGNRK
jgi:hypothetical protein